MDVRCLDRQLSQISIHELPFRTVQQCGLRDGLQPLAVNDRQQSQRGSARPFLPALPIGNKVLRDIEIAREHRLRDMLSFADGLYLVRLQWRRWSKARHIELAQGERR